MTRKLHSFGLRDYCEHISSCHNVADTIAHIGISSLSDGIAVCAQCAPYYIRKGYNLEMTWILRREQVTIATSYSTKHLLKYFQAGDKIERNPHI